MKLFRTTVLLTTFFILSTLTLRAQVLPSGTTDNGCQSVATPLSPITFTEQSTNDFNPANAVAETLVFEPTSGSFVPGSGNVSFTTGDITTQILVTASQITVTLTGQNTGHLSTLDILTISDIQIVSSSAESIEIRYISGTSVVDGLNATDPVAYVNVEDGPTAPNTFAPGVCSSLNTSFDIQNHVTSSGNNQGGFYQYVAADNVVTTGEPLSPVNSSYITNAVYNPSGSIENIVYTVTGTNFSSGCIGAPFTITMPINPVPIGTTRVADACSGVAHNINPQTIVTSFGNGLGGATFTWTNVYTDPGITGVSPTGVGSITDILINPSSDLRGALYEVIGTSSLGCIGPVFSVTAHAMPPPLIAGPTSVCEDAPFTFVATNPAGTYTWGDDGAPAVTSGGGSGDTHVELTWPGTGVGFVSVNYTNSYGCSGTANHPVAITNQAPAGAADVLTVCSNAGINFNPQSTVLSLGNGIPATFSWVAADNTDVTGESLSSQPDIITDNLRNFQSSAEAVVYTIVPTGACGVGPNFTLTVTVNPEPIGVNNTTATCGGAMINFDLTGSVSNVAGSTFSWIAIDNPNTIGETYGTATPSSSITDNPNLSENYVNEVITYTVTPFSSVGCSGDNFTILSTIQKAPAATLLNADVCSGTISNLDLQSHVNSDGNGVNATYSWIAQADNPNISGESLSTQNSTFITDVLVNALTFKQSVQYLVTGTSVVANCTGSPFTVLASVDPTPAGPASSSETLCSGASINFDINAAFIAGGNGVVSIFEWAAADNTNTTGETIAPQTANTIADALTNATGNPENIVYTITPTSLLGGCEGAPFVRTVTVNPIPTTNITNSALGISNNAPTDITLTSNVAGASFDFVATAPASISGASSGAGAAIAQVLTNSTTSQQVVTYTITATANGCSGTAFVTTVTVNGMRTIITADSVALVALYNALSGPNWTQSTNWLAGSANTWHGVDVSSERVIGLSLPSNNLTGNLPTAFFNLSQLSLLDLQDNAISGNLPSDISNLTSLQILDVRNNDLTGPLPAALYNTTSLTQLRLRGNDFSGGFLPAISNLTNLQTLQAEGLPMTDPIPAEVFGLTSLVNLGLSGKINGPLPATLGSLTALFTFSCDSCGITSVPGSITGLTNLISLSLHNNSIESLPDMSSLPLSTLNVGKNSLTFESLEPHTAIANFLYTPQDTVGIPTTLVLQTTTAHNFSANVGGSANQYVWKKDNAVIPAATSATYTLASPVFADEGTYHAEVTSSLLPGLTITTSPAIAKVSSLKRDSLSLLAVFDATNGPGWTTKGGWATGNLSTWNGVVISSNRVTALNLANNNLTGPLPAAFTDLRSLQTANLSGNKLSEIPAVSSMTTLTNLNVASNNISFGSLEPNATVLSKITYSPQNVIGTASVVNLPAGSPTSFSAVASGANNSYQWKRNGNNVSGAIVSTFAITSLTRSNMGQYSCQITNSTVPGLILQTAPKTVLATAELSGKVSVAENTPAQKGKAILLRINSSAAFDTVSIKDISTEGSYAFSNVVLDDYQIVALADRATHLTALPTYYKNTVFWEEADTLFVNNDLTDLNITTAFEPAPPSGRGLISGTITEDVPSGTGGRTQLPKPVRSAGVSARRVQGTGRGLEEKLILVAYVFTNENGEFSLENLPEGNYRLNIQYPGYPMDETSFINFTIGTGLQAEVKVEAQVERGVINVRQLIITNVWSKENYSAEVYPNPTSSVIKMKFGTTSFYRDVGIFDRTGKKIAAIDAFDETLEVNVSNFAKGLYLINVSDKGALVKSLHVIIE